MRGHRDQKSVRVVAGRLDSDGLAFQVADAADLLAGEQLVAADMDPGEDRQPAAIVGRLDRAGGEIQREIGTALADYGRQLAAGSGVDISDVTKTFGAQQLFRDVLRSDADAGKLHQADARRFQRALCGRGPGRPKERGGAR
jgi:hypothetical protein